jgi:dTDP-4-amino-4,6-dideoxygalactose transaminase
MTDDAPDYMRPWPAHAQEGLELSGVLRVLDSNRLQVGEEVEALEREFASWLGGGVEVIAVSSGTGAIEAATLAYADELRGRVVAVPVWTFISTVSPFARLDCELRFADCLRDGTVDPDELRRIASEEDLRAIVATDVDGTPISRQVTELAGELGIPLIEDACPAYGAYLCYETPTEVRSRPAGLLGDVATFSTSDSKILAAGEGGFVVTTDPELADRLRAVRRYGELHGVERQFRVADYIGSNLKMPELTAAIARANLLLLDARIERAKSNARLLDEALGEMEMLRPRVRRSPFVDPMPHKYRLRFDRHDVARCDVEELLRRHGVRFLDEVGPLADHPAFSYWSSYRPRTNAHSSAPRRAPTSGAYEILRTTVPIGDRDYPLWHAPEPMIQKWIDGLWAVDRELKEQNRRAR